MIKTDLVIAMPVMMVAKYAILREKDTYINLYITI